MKNFVQFFLITLLFLALPTLTALGQPPPPPPQDIPIDGGLLALLISGLAIGGKKFYKKKSEK